MLTPKQREVLESLRNLGVLEDVRHHLINFLNGIMIFCCSDGDQFLDKIKHLVGLHWSPVLCLLSRFFCWMSGRPFQKRGRTHLFALNGGALLLSPSAPFPHGETVRELLREQVETAMNLKGISNLVLYAHVPCGMAKLYDMDVVQVIENLIQAKEWVTQTFSEVKVACFLQVDWGKTWWGGTKKRTYFISREKWRKYREEIALLLAA